MLRRCFNAPLVATPFCFLLVLFPALLATLVRGGAAHISCNISVVDTLTLSWVSEFVRGGGSVVLEGGLPSEKVGGLPVMRCCCDAPLIAIPFCSLLVLLPSLLVTLVRGGSVHMSCNVSMVDTLALSWVSDFVRGGGSAVLEGGLPSDASIGC